jgi:hypothetical protein
MLLAPSISGLFKWRQFEPDVILLAVGWYLRFSLSYREAEELLAERGLWVDRRLRRHLKPTSVAIMEHTGLSNYAWHLPLFFLARVVLFSSVTECCYHEGKAAQLPDHSGLSLSCRPKPGALWRLPDCYRRQPLLISRRENVILIAFCNTVSLITILSMVPKSPS